MTDYLTLTEFIPGTKAKAQEVNSNFSVLKEAIKTKAAKEGNSSQTFEVAEAVEDTHAITKSQLDETVSDLTDKISATSTKFCVKSGNITSGKGDLFSYDILEISFKVGGGYANLVTSNYIGELNTFSTLADIDMTGYADGEYNIFITSEGETYISANSIYKQPSRPTMVNGDVWLNTGIEPIKAIKYNNAADDEFLDVPLGKVIIEDEVITSIETFEFNQNGYDVNAQSKDWRRLLPDYSKGIGRSWNTEYVAESDGWIYVYSSDRQNLTTTSFLIIQGQYLVVVTNSMNYGIGASLFLPISKGEKYKGISGENQNLRFYPVMG